MNSGGGTAITAVKSDDAYRGQMHLSCRYSVSFLPCIWSSTGTWLGLRVVQDDIRSPSLEIPPLQFVSQGLVGNIKDARRMFSVPVCLFQCSKNELSLRLFCRVSTDLLQEQWLMRRRRGSIGGRDFDLAGR